MPAPFGPVSTTDAPVKRQGQRGIVAEIAELQPGDEGAAGGFASACDELVISARVADTFRVIAGAARLAYMVSVEGAGRRRFPR